ncbi:MAG: HAMP domain-containing histidine kinase [Ruminococcus flavefaciens]|nr:HAMP domain-containing histidine kinase [Ruminococcus flavefaciens]
MGWFALLQAAWRKVETEVRMEWRRRKENRDADAAANGGAPGEPGTASGKLSQAEEAEKFFGRASGEPDKALGKASKEADKAFGKASKEADKAFGKAAAEMDKASRKSEKQSPGKKRRPPRWVSFGILVCLGAALLLTFFYGFLADSAKKWRGNLLESKENISWLFQSSYLLYKDLCNSRQEAQLDYRDVYLKPTSGYEWLLEEEEVDRRIDILEENEWGESGEGERDSAEWTDYDSIALNELHQIQIEVNNLGGCFNNLENNFKRLNSIFDYLIRDDITGKYITNMSQEDAEGILEYENLADYRRFFLLVFQFDGAGNITVGAVRSENGDRLRKTANEVIRDDTPLLSLVKNNMNYARRYLGFVGPANCTVIYAASADYLSAYTAQSSYTTEYVSSDSAFLYYSEDAVSREAYRAVGLDGILFLFLLVLFLLGLFLPVLKETRPWEESPVCSLPFEILFVLGLCSFAPFSLAEELIVYVAGGQAEEALINAGFWDEAAFCITMGYNLILMAAFFFCFWYLGICARAVRKMGIREYIRERSLIYRFFPFLKRKAIGAYEALQHLDLTQDAHKTIVKLLLVNGVILFVISSLWFGGFFVTIIYSGIMYLILRKYVSDLQKKYRILLRATNEMAEGHLNVTIEEDLGVFEPFKPHFIRIQDGFRRAVDEEVKSQRMKAELITNVSHDLKTPLTAIITYVNLLQEEGITEQQRKEYLKILESKSLRLKILIEDLFEVSKANSQNITLNLTEVDIMNLLKQVAFEMGDKLQEAGLDVRMKLTEEKVLLSLDSQKTYRIYENLFGNIAKYAMRGTRVYVNGFRIDDTVVITLKNISAQELTVDSSELTERFVRGDASRNTEGSGLGLAIAKSFTELQGGELTLETDGDLFKATTVWRLKAGESGQV